MQRERSQNSKPIKMLMNTSRIQEDKILIHVSTNVATDLSVTSLWVSQPWDISEKHVKTLKTPDN